MDGFTAIRNGLLEHVRQGKFCAFDLGVYLFLHLTADWATGVCFTNARAIAVQFGGKENAKDVRQALYRLRQKRYINYRDGDGSRGCYDILIHKCRPTVGGHVGMQLNAFAAGSLDTPVYEAYNSEPTVDGLSANSATTVDGPIQDIKTFRQESEGAGAPSSRRRAKRKQVSMPDGFQPKESHRKLAQELGVDLGRAFPKFCDHHLSKGHTFKDWDLALNTWLRNEVDFRRTIPTNGNGNGSNGATKVTFGPIDRTPPSVNPEAKRILEDADRKAAKAAAR